MLNIKLYHLAEYSLTTSKISLKAGLIDELPTMNPSTSANLIKFSQLESVTDPAYITLVLYATSLDTFVDIQFLINS